MAWGSGGKFGANWTSRPRKRNRASRMRFENGTSGKLDVPPADRAARASADAGRIHSMVRPARSEAYRVMDPPTSGATSSRADPARSSMTRGAFWTMVEHRRRRWDEASGAATAAGRRRRPLPRAVPRRPPCAASIARTNRAAALARSGSLSVR